MDKNLINIDDLVRQRLSGGEERERSGAWLRMRELLDKEEERKPPGLIWRNMFGALAVLILIASVSLGGYELSSYYKRTADAGNTLPVASTANVKSTNSHIGDIQPNDNQSSAVVIAANNQPQNNELIKPTTEKHKKATGKTLLADNKSVASSVVATPTVNSKHTDAERQPKSSAANEITNNTKKETIAASENKLAETVKTDISVANANSDKSENSEISKVARVPARKAGKQRVKKTANGIASTDKQNRKETPNETASVNDEGTNTTPVAKPVPAASVPENTGTTAVPAKSKETASAKKTVSAKKEAIAAKNTNSKPHITDGTKVATTHNPTNTKSATTKSLTASDHSGAGNNTPKTDAGSKKQTTSPIAAITGNPHSSKAGAGKSIAAASVTSKPVTKTKSGAQDNSVATSATARAGKGLDLKKMPLSSKSGPSAGAAKAISSTGTIAAKNTPVLKKGSKHTAGKTGAAAAGTHAVAENKTSGAASSAPITLPAVVKPAIDNTAINKISAINTKKGKRVIEKVVVSERHIKTAPNTFSARLDTISMESVTEEFGLAEEKSDAPATAMRKAADENATANSGNTPLVPDAAPPVASAPATGSNEKEHNTGSGGGHKLESLQSAFNDIKYKVSGAQFAMGLTGGVNGTFFGPNSFKGFQFGVTSTFIFSESVSILGELEYFHRANNDYTFNDNYYTYTQIGPNMWNKQLQQNPYSFSTLHSFEMPLVVRYTKSKFSFMAGINVAYSFAINEAQGLPVTGSTSQYAGATPANDTTAKVKTNDFNSRIGLGYVFGIGVQLSPNVSIDLRDVQTFWDNAQTAGAKEISSQLYRSPSFQLSLGYRFGGRKGKDKE